MPFIVSDANWKKLISTVENNKTIQNKDERTWFGESRECVAAVQSLANAPHTSFWKRGALVKNNFSIKKGTVIATFKSESQYKGHAAIYVEQNSNGIIVYDQWKTKAISMRLIRFNRPENGISNDGDKFYVVEK